MTHEKTVTTIFEKKKLSAMANCASRLALLLEVDKALQPLNDVWSRSIKEAIRTNVSQPVIKMIQDCITTDYWRVADMLGVELTDKIKCS